MEKEKDKGKDKEKDHNKDKITESELSESELLSANVKKENIENIEPVLSTLLYLSFFSTLISIIIPSVFIYLKHKQTNNNDIDNFEIVTFVTIFVCFIVGSYLLYSKLFPKLVTFILIGFCLLVLFFQITMYMAQIQHALIKNNEQEQIQAQIQTQIQIKETIKNDVDKNYQALWIVWGIVLLLYCAYFYFLIKYFNTIDT